MLKCYKPEQFHDKLVGLVQPAFGFILFYYFSQILRFQRKTKLSTSHVDRSLDGKKLVGIQFVVEQEQDVAINQSDITGRLDTLVASFESRDIGSWPQGFSDLVQILRKSNEASLHGVVGHLWNGKSKNVLNFLVYFLNDHLLHLLI